MESVYDVERDAKGEPLSLHLIDELIHSLVYRLNQPPEETTVRWGSTQRHAYRALGFLSEPCLHNGAQAVCNQMVPPDAVEVTVSTREGTRKSGRLFGLRVPGISAE